MVPMPPRNEVDFYKHWRENILSNPVVVMRVIEVDGAVAGHVSSFFRNERFFIGYWLGKKYWGRGIASAAVAEFIARHEARRPLSACVAVTNGASLRVLIKCGFKIAEKSVKGPDEVEEYRLELT